MKLTAEQWQRYVDNTCSERERKEIFNYLNGLSSGELETILEAAFPVEAISMPPLSAKKLDKKLEQLTGITLRPRPALWKLSPQWVAAAGILLLAVLTWHYFFPVSQRSQKQQAQTHTQNISNTTTHVRKVILTDGSQVWLSPQTTLHISDDFNNQRRELTLSGQGYFEVAHNPSKPFIVNAGYLQTIVLGTHFNIEAYPEELHSIVSLTEGKVSVRANTTSGTDRLIYLQPGNKLVYRNAEKKFDLQPVDVDYEKSWRNCSLVFDGLSVSDVFLRLEHRFGKKILFDPMKFKGKKFTATYPHENLDLILRDMSFVQGFHYRQQKDTILIQQ